MRSPTITAYGSGDRPAAPTKHPARSRPPKHERAAIVIADDSEEPRTTQDRTDESAAEQTFVTVPHSPPSSARASLARAESPSSDGEAAPEVTKTAPRRAKPSATASGAAAYRTTDPAQTSQSMFYSCHADRCAKRRTK